MRLALLRVYGLAQWAEHHTLRTTGLGECQELEGRESEPTHCGKVPEAPSTSVSRYQQMVEVFF